MCTTLRTLRMLRVLRMLRIMASGLLALGGMAAWGQGGHTPPPLPEGLGREIAQAKCVTCHDATRLSSPGYDRGGWQNEITRMEKIGVTLTPEQLPILTDYLVRSFPPQEQAAAKVIPGGVQVRFQEWTVAPADAFPHDPLATADGALWYTGQHASVLGRIDPATGAIHAYPTKIADSGPHGLAADRAGNIWFTANYAAYVGKLDPASGAVTDYKMPDPAARDPHTPVFDAHGTLWFTVQGANMIGRLVPATGEVKLAHVPTAHALPYGMVVSSRGVPFFAEFGTNRIGEIDPNTMAIREHALPNAGTRPRRIAITSDDVLWYSDYARGFLGSYDPKSGTGREWPSPGGAGAQPYGITALHDVIWYSESGVHPNTLVRFDPKSQTFQSWAIPSGGGVVRNMMPTRDGRLVLAESGAGKVALATIE